MPACSQLRPPLLLEFRDEGIALLHELAANLLVLGELGAVHVAVAVRRLVSDLLSPRLVAPPGQNMICG